MADIPTVEAVMAFKAACGFPVPRVLPLCQACGVALILELDGLFASRQLLPTSPMADTQVFGFSLHPVPDKHCGLQAWLHKGKVRDG